MKNILIIILILAAFNAFASKRSEVVQSLFRVVENWMGTPYEYGNTDKEGVDCSGFTSKVYSEVFKIQLPRSVSGQKQVGDLVKDKLQPGDLIFFNIDGKICHVGIYVFDNKFIHAASAGPETGVIKSSLNENYYKTRYAYAKRVIQLPGFENDDKTNLQVAESNEVSSLNLVFGKTLYRNKIYDESDIFSEDTPMYFKIVCPDKTPCEFTLMVENVDTSKIVNTMDLQIIDKDINKKISLKKGIYSVKILKDDREILNKELTVN